MSGGEQPAIRTRARLAAEEAQRELIANYTCRVVAREGIEGASFRRIAEELGCTTGLITHYFPTKEDLLIAALKMGIDALAAEVDNRSDPATTLDEWIDNCVDFLPTDETRLQCWRVNITFQAAALTNERLAEAYYSSASRYLPPLRDLVETALGPKRRPEHVDEVVDGLWAIVDGLGVSATLNPTTYTPERVREMLRACCRGLLALH
ncbi:TetR/AcrR family transcriptional regulator [Mycolicibacterium sp. P9-64]|uniref:TetR/AcrR family transcriptional regulator n=1 Tax=Mycolicibacterium sp. P9-64 TaxID=2024612 RepID=UPI0011EF8892|nr:TetR/AcrR family transcriptional regulator [Mycolicibacterium sp. P9-64]